MTTLAQVLEFMFPGLEGIRTGRSGITDWPSGGPAQPTQVAIDQGFIDFDAGKSDRDAARDVDATKLTKSIVLWLVDELNTLGRTPPLTVASARTAIIAKYKGLP